MGEEVKVEVEESAETADAAEEEQSTTAESKEEEKKEDSAADAVAKETKEENKAEEKAEGEEADSEKKEGGDEKNGDEEEGEDESSDEELPPGLLERPVEIYGEKRQRKKVARFIPDEISTPSPAKKAVVIKEGSGVKLSSHPRVCHQLNKNKVADLKLVHKLLYGVWGDVKSIKSNILQFSGFTFEKDSKEYEKTEDYISGFTMDNLKWLMECVDVKAK